MAAKADFEIGGLSVSEIARKYGIAKSSVSAKSRNWEPNKTERSVCKKANAIIELAEVGTETEQKLNAVERVVFDRVVADDVAFRLQSDERMEATALVAMQLLEGADKMSDVKMAMETLRIQREARLGKIPDTMVQVNNGEVASGIDRLHARRIGGRDA